LRRAIGLLSLLHRRTKATHPFLSHGHDGSPSLLPLHAGRIDIVDMWARSPLDVSGALCGLDDEKVEVPSTLRTIPDVGSERSLQFTLWYKSQGTKLLTLLFRSSASQDRNHHSSLLILKLALLYCL
jgi:hypothetical protein